MIQYDEQEIIKKYQSGIKLKPLSEQFNCTIDKIRWSLKKHNIWKPAKTAKCINLPEQEIINLYKQDISIKDIAKKYNISTSPIAFILKKNNIRKPVWAKQLPFQTYIKVSDKEFFIAKCKELVSKKNISDYFNINYDMVAALCKKYKIETPPSAIVRSINKQKNASIQLTKENFITLHYKQNVTVGDIALKMGISNGYLRKMIKSWGITIIGQEIRLSTEFKELRNNIEQLKELVKTIPLKQLCIQYKVSRDVLRKLLNENNISIPIKYRSTDEKKIEKFLFQHLSNIDIEICNRTVIYPYELDFFIPSKNIAIEYCGLYWHSELRGKNNNYHLKKLQKCSEKGIRLITIFEDEFKNNETLVFNKIKHCLNIFPISNKIHARQCIVKEIPAKQKREFLDKFHIQGNDISSVFLGLYYDNKLISVMTFSTPSRSRASKNMLNTEGLWELNRYATDYNYLIRGGAGKLLTYFKNNFSWKTIYSYADRRWSVGELYKTLGFKLEKISKPNYWYLPPNCSKRIYRYNFTKASLIKQGFDLNLTEKQIMKQRGFTRIWDCGMLKFTIQNK